MRPHAKGHLKGHPARHCRPAGLATLPGDRVGDAIEVRVECGEIGLERQALSQGGRTAQIAVADNGVDDPTLAACTSRRIMLRPEVAPRYVPRRVSVISSPTATLTGTAKRRSERPKG